MNRQLVYIILAVAVLLFIGMIIKDGWFSSKKDQKKERSSRSASQKALEITLPLCLQAYERLVVFLERMRIESLIRRLSRPGVDVQETRQLLIHTIRTEYEHNLSQQVYVSTAAWEAVENAKEQLIHLIHTVASQLPAEESGSLLHKKLLDLNMQETDWPVTTALKVLNSESKKLLAISKY